MDYFEQLLTETKYSTQDTLKRMKFEENEIQSMILKKQLEIQKLKEKYPQITDETEIMQEEINIFLKDLIKAIEEEYKEYIPEDRIKKLINLPNNIIIYNNIEDNHDFSADSKNGKIMINLAKIGKSYQNPNPDIYTKVVTAKGTLPHEIFHIIIQLLKPEELADERMIINISGCKEPLTSRGMVGFMINEGFVEKFSNEFCDKHDFYHDIAFQYIPYVNICNYIMKINPLINEQTIFSINEEDCLKGLNEKERQMYYKAEAISYAVRHGSKKLGREIKWDDVISSSVEKVFIDLNEIPPDRLAELKSLYQFKTKLMNGEIEIKTEKKR